ncbi:MAG: hypothetical protein HY923_04540 [Elusimicrobia bacterium]|nr:hypothetical protein [Elusimicrobiota bacterium]
MKKWLIIELLFVAILVAPTAYHGRVAANETEDLKTQLGSIRAAMSIYYGDMEGKYPDKLERVIADPKYMPRPPRVFAVYANVPGRGVMRVHTREDMMKIRHFGSVKSADDLGGWGYVNDPKSPEYGLVFINCTHREVRRKMVWKDL